MGRCKTHCGFLVQLATSEREESPGYVVTLKEFESSL